MSGSAGAYGEKYYSENFLLADLDGWNRSGAHTLFMYIRHQKEPRAVKPKAVLSKLNGPAKSGKKQTTDKAPKAAVTDELKNAPKGSASNSDDTEDASKTREEK